MVCIFCSTDLSNLFWYSQTSICLLASSLALRAGNEFPGLLQHKIVITLHNVPSRFHLDIDGMKDQREVEELILFGLCPMDSLYP